MPNNSMNSSKLPMQNLAKPNKSIGNMQMLNNFKKKTNSNDRVIKINAVMKGCLFFAIGLFALGVQPRAFKLSLKIGLKINSLKS